MTVCSTKCYLESVDDPDEKIHLPHKRRVSIGRDNAPRNCFRQDAQVFARADLKQKIVIIENVGRTRTWCGTRQLRLAERCVLTDGETVAVQDGQKVYRVAFYPSTPAERKPLRREAVKFLLPKKDEETTGVKRIRGRWEQLKEGLLIYTPPNSRSSCFIAGFALIDTLVKIDPKSRWTVAYKEVPDKLKSLRDKGYKIVIFSNNVLTDSFELGILKRKVSTLMRRFGVPLQFFMPTHGGMNQKPVIGMWYAMQRRNDDKTTNTARSFYVGSLAGRKEGWQKGRSKDPTNEDRLFAVNAGVKFFTPEEYFLASPIAQYRFPKFNPREPCCFDFVSLVSRELEVVVMVGAPDSGKTWFCKRHLVPAGYLHVTVNNRVEILRSADVITEFLMIERKIVVDGMNASVETRKVFLDVAKKRCVRIRCFVMKVSEEQLAHNRKFRELTHMKDGSKTEEERKQYETCYREPDKNEGFDDVIQLPFSPTFEDVNMNALYRMFLLSD